MGRLDRGGGGGQWLERFVFVKDKPKAWPILLAFAPRGFYKPHALVWYGQPILFARPPVVVKCRDANFRVYS